jgi:hypothetical protein
MEDSKQPRPKLRPPFEGFQLFEKGREHILDQVFRVLFREPQRSCRPDQWSRVIVHGACQ